MEQLGRWYYLPSIMSMRKMVGKMYIINMAWEDWNNQELNLQGRTKSSVKGHKVKEWGEMVIF